MKLSNIKVYKQKGINNSRKKYKIIKGKKHHNKSNRKNPKKTDIKRKTVKNLKIYVGGGGCAWDDISSQDGKLEMFSNMSYDKKKEYIERYYTYDKDCSKDYYEQIRQSLRAMLVKSFHIDNNITELQVKELLHIFNNSYYGKLSSNYMMFPYSVINNSVMLPPNTILTEAQKKEVEKQIIEYNNKYANSIGDTLGTSLPPLTEEDNAGIDEIAKQEFERIQAETETTSGTTTGTASASTTVIASEAQAQAPSPATSVSTSGTETETASKGASEAGTVKTALASESAKIASNCKSKNIIIDDAIMKQFREFNQDKRVEYINSSFLAGDNKECLADAKRKIMLLLQNVWTNSKKNAVDENNINILRELWETSLTSSGNDTYRDPLTGIYGVFNIGLQDITVKPSAPLVSPKTSGEIVDDLNNLKKACGRIPTISASGNLTNIPTLINDIQQSVATTWNTLNKVKQFKLFNITGNGDCLYEAIVTGMFNKGIGKYINAPGWFPEKKGTDGPGLPNYMGNLRYVLAKYICINIADEGFLTNFGTVELTRTIARILSTNISKSDQGSPNSGWGEDTELKLMARLFDICIAVYREDLRQGQGIFQYINNYGNVIIEPSDVPNMCEGNLIYIINKDGISHYDLLIPDTEGPSNMSAE